MKLSEAIRLGATLKPQVYNGGREGSCALAAAAEAVGLQRNSDDIIPYYCLEELFPILAKRPSTVPDCNGTRIYQKQSQWTLKEVIFGLNDIEHWTREQIADYVESIEQEHEQQLITMKGETISA